jgi:hypothetical protein
VDISQIATAVGALGIGSVLGQWLANGGQRRQVRADALLALSEVESNRWWSTEANATAKPFIQAARTLQAACVIARVPRKAVTEYLIYAQAALWQSHENWELNPDDDSGPSIEAHFSQLVRDAAKALADVIWAPTIFRFITVRKFNKLAGNKRLGQLDPSYIAQIKQSRRYQMTF